MKKSEIKVGKTYRLDFGWRIEVSGFQKVRAEDGAWDDETMVTGLKWNECYGKDTAHNAFAKISELSV